MLDPSEHRTSAPRVVYDLGVASAMAVLDLRRWSRDRLAVLSACLLPAGVALLVTVALGGDSSFSTRWAIVDNDGGPAAEVFDDRVLGAPELERVVSASVVGDAEARSMLDNDEVTAVVVLGDGLSEALAASEIPPIEVIAPDEASIGTDLAYLAVDQFRIRSWTEAAITVDGAEAPTEWPIEVTVGSASGARLDAATFYGPAIAMVFILLTLGMAAQTQVADRLSGVLERLRSLRAPVGAVVIGRCIAAGAIGGLSFGIVAVTMGVVFGRTWGATVPVTVLVLAVLLCIIGIAAVLAAIARTATQAQVYATVVALMLAIGSGAFTPPGFGARPWYAPGLPTSWALDAFAELAAEGATMAEILPQLVGLSLMGLVLVMIATGLMRART